MTGRPPAVPLVLSAAVLMAAAAWWLTDNTPLDDRAASAQRVAPEEPTLPPQTDREIIEPPPSPTIEPLPALDHGADDGAFSNQDLWVHISDPANSDLPPHLFAEISQLGADIVRADATGQGRDRWPDYWSTDDQQGSRAEPCCTDITTHAAGAFTHPNHPGLVQVTVIWTGLIPKHEDLVEQITHLRLRRNRVGWHPFDGSSS